MSKIGGKRVTMTATTSPGQGCDVWGELFGVNDLIRIDGVGREATELSRTLPFAAIYSRRPSAVKELSILHAHHFGVNEPLGDSTLAQKD